MSEISDFDIYVQRMQKSFLDKMFFIDKIFDPIDTVVDFGCANGVLINALKFLFPEYKYIGYDISSEMISMAKKFVPDTDFFENWNDIKICPERSLINISSTLHEVYSYGNDDSVKEFWERVFGTGFKYIAIRDMMISESSYRPADAEDAAKARRLYPGKLKDFESVWGSIEDQANLIHYLLKYRYTENWDREVHENYIPITTEKLISLIPDDYEVIYSEHYVLPYIDQQIRKDSGIKLNDSTHFKILIKKKNI